MIQACEKDCAAERSAISGEQERIRRAVSRLTTWLVVAALASVGLLLISKWLILLPMAGGLIAFYKFHEEREDARSRILRAEAVISAKNC